MRNSKIKKMVLVAVLTAIMLLFGFTPIGYIPLGVIQVTLMCIPLIIGTLTLGLKVGIYLGAVFGLTSFAQLFVGASSIFTPLFFSPVNAYDPFLFILTIFVPRLLIAPIVHYSAKGLGNVINKKPVVTGICSAIGSLANTVIFLGMMYIFFGGQINDIIANMGLGYESSGIMLAIVGATNGLPEAAVAVIICTPVITALSKIYVKTGDK